MNPTYSIIIPHYNTPDLLMRCLASIPVREDVQVIVVDDNSPDVETYPDRYPELSRPNLEFIRTTKGGGAGYARNVGLDQAEGKWLLFADSDDFFVEDFGGILDRSADYPEEIVFFRYLAVYSDDISKPSQRDGHINQLIDRYLKSGDETDIRCAHAVPWGKMIRTDLVRRHNIRFDEIRYSNDIVFSILSGCKAASIRFEDNPLYVVTERKGSLTHEFCGKPGEFVIRTEAAYRAQRAIFEHGFPFSESQEFPKYLYDSYHVDKKLYKKYFRLLPSLGISRRKTIYKVRIRQKGIIRKLFVYPYSWLLCLS